MREEERLVFDLFKNYEIFLVGGSVRDKLLGRDFYDFDFATNAKPEEIEKILLDANLYPHRVGWAYGTVGFYHNGNDFHITTYRKDEVYQRDNRKPIVEWGSTIKEDLSRRDFTINALAQDRDGKIIDLFNGQQHLEDRIIKTPGDPEKAFSEDPLRLLRAIRFSNKLDFEYNEETAEALDKYAYKVLTLSKERILEEFTKILLLDFAACALEDMISFRMLHYIIPELTVLADIKQNTKYHYKDVWDHTTDVVGEIEKDPISRWAALFHDIGKPYTLSTDDDDIHFYRHEEVSARMAESIAKRLGISNKWLKAIVFMVRHHMRPNLYEEDWSDTAVRRFVKDMGGMLDKVLELSRADITSHKPETISSHIDNLSDLETRCEGLKEYKNLKCPLKGNDIMSHYKIGPGPEVGRMQRIIVDALLAGDLKPTLDTKVYLDYLDKVKDG